MGESMKLILALSIVFFSGQVFAGKSLVFEANGEFHGRYKPQAAFFDHSKRKGTAAVVVRGVYDDFWYDDNWPNERFHYFDVEGLYFDRSIGKRGAVLYDHNGETIVCAHRRFLGGSKKTGNCILRVIDDKRGQYRVQMSIKSK